jgi:hypothetical protein
VYNDEGFAGGDLTIDEHDNVVYTQLASELANEPDYESVLAAL